ncbi:hypothetical protein H4R33_004691 [Dimargaris cristalligena]|uniref:Glycine cleavage system H protein n=1 Tax=Dimargaris cristalligena TaxID=215637 RepID=A0A4Q0A1V1_9FUNG|nr:hypothetical protein H4R33_004691 [Dimargaris cristalligena]RKP40027.1 glycine cleavage H-protein-domain-containing protein [Dimargaris cristalligena]|eukprot:RKP40027.1 glycine cleavage H-protein-domain-containing protein [Dimargaris cristalligena]
MLASAMLPRLMTRCSPRTPLVRPAPLALCRYYSSGAHFTKFTKTHEWVHYNEGTVTVGITDFAQKHLGDVVFVELPETEVTVEANEAVGSVESVKAASDIYAPASGMMVEANEELENNPGLINKSPTTEAWIFKLKVDSAEELKDLMDAKEYESFCSTSD